MPDDRRQRSDSGRGGKKRGPVRKRDGRADRTSRGATRGGRTSTGRSRRRDGDGSRDRRNRPRSGTRTEGRRQGGRDGASGRPPRTEAERRAAQVRATRGPRRTPRTDERERDKIEQRTTERWIDEGSIRDEAVGATARAAGRRPDRSAPAIDPEVVAEIHAALDAPRAHRAVERLAAASEALDRGRYDDARSRVTPLLRELPQVAAVHEVHGLAAYGAGRWTQAASSLELARQLRQDPALLPVLADCYRAVGRWDDVDDVWDEIKAASPSHEVMTEGRIVQAGAMADRGEYRPAIELLTSASRPPKRVRTHHLRQWYALADLHDRAGDPVGAARWFDEVARRDPQFADVRDRLRSLGR